MAEWQVVLREASKMVTPELVLPHSDSVWGEVGWDGAVESSPV